MAEISTLFRLYLWIASTLFVPTWHVRSKLVGHCCVHMSSGLPRGNLWIQWDLWKMDPFLTKKRCPAEPWSEMRECSAGRILFEWTGNASVTNCLIACWVSCESIVAFCVYANFRKWVNFRFFALFLSVVKKRLFSRSLLRLPEPYRCCRLTWISICLSVAFCQVVRALMRAELQFFFLFKGQAGVIANGRNFNIEPHVSLERTKRLRTHLTCTQLFGGALLCAHVKWIAQRDEWDRVGSLKFGPIFGRKKRARQSLVRKWRTYWPERFFSKQPGMNPLLIVSLCVEWCLVSLCRFEFMCIFANGSIFAFFALFWSSKKTPCSHVSSYASLIPIVAAVSREFRFVWARHFVKLFER